MFAGPATSPFHSVICSGSARLAGQIVVEPPNNAREQNREGPEDVLQARRARPGEDNCSNNKADHSQRDAPIEIFMEDEPSQESSRGTFQRQEERSRRCLRSREPEHQQERTNHAAGCNGRGKPGNILSLQRCLPCVRGAKQPRRQATQQSYADARPAVEEPGKNGGIDRAEQDLGSRCRDAKQRCRGECVEDRAARHGAMLSPKRHNATE
jgi:hypothetical protein